MNEKIRSILSRHGRLIVDVALLDDTTDLYEVGLSSQASVEVMLALESEFDIEFEDRMLGRRLFSTIANIQNAIAELESTHRIIPRGV